MNEQPQQFRPGQVPGTWEHGRLQTISDSAQMVHNLSVAPPLTLAKSRFGMRLGIRLPAARKGAAAAAVEAGPQIRPVVLVTGASDLLEVRAVTYDAEDRPILEGKYAWDGEKFQAYPEFGARYQDYAGLVSTDDPPNADTEFLLVYKVGPIWVLTLLPAIAQFIVANVADYPDTIECVAVAGDVDTTVHVARPYLLRRTPFDTLTRGEIAYDYTSNTERIARKQDAEGNETTENQLIIPRYIVGDEIVAVASVWRMQHRYPLVAGGEPAIDVQWLDLDQSRAWTQKAGNDS